MKETITITEQVPFKRVADMLCNALEGGSNYWYEIIRFSHPAVWSFTDGAKEDKHYAHTYPFNEGGALWMRDSEERTGDHRELRNPVKLDFKRIEKGLQVMARDFRKHYADFLNDNDDATTADVFLQCCLFGDVVYG